MAFKEPVYKILERIKNEPYFDGRVRLMVT